MEPVQTLVRSAANGGFEPEVIDAAACTFLHEGRRDDLRCRCEMISLENQLQTRAMSILVVLTVAYYHGNLGFSSDLHLGSIYETALTKSPK